MRNNGRQREYEGMAQWRTSKGRNNLLAEGFNVIASLAAIKPYTKITE